MAFLDYVFHQDGQDKAQSNLEVQTGDRCHKGDQITAQNWVTSSSDDVDTWAKIDKELAMSQTYSVGKEIVVDLGRIERGRHWW